MQDSAILRLSHWLLMAGQKMLKTHKKKPEEENWLIRTFVPLAVFLFLLLLESS